MVTYKFGYQITDSDGNPAMDNPQPVSLLLDCLRAGVAAYRKVLLNEPHADIQFYISRKPVDGGVEDEAPLNFYDLSSGVAIWAGTGYETDFEVPRAFLSKVQNALRDRTSHAALLADEIIRLSQESYRAWANQPTAD